MMIETWAVVFATLLGPVLAVQAQQAVQRIQQKRERRAALFRTLMVTRALSLSYEHVGAVNSVPLDFRGVRDVMEKWRVYLDFLNRRQEPNQEWGNRRTDLFVDLLGAIAKRVGYKEFDPVQLRNEIYAPQGHARIEADNLIIRQGLVELLTGEAALPLDVKSIAQDPEVAGRIKELQELLAGWLRGTVVPRVRVHDGPPEQAMPVPPDRR